MNGPSLGKAEFVRAGALRSIAACGAFVVLAATFAVAAEPPVKPSESGAQVPPVAPPSTTPLIEYKSSLPPAATVAGHETGLIPREVLFGNPDKAMARMSHDGKWLSYLAPVAGVLNVWVAPIDNPAAAKAVTKEKDRPIDGYFWAYTNRHILYTQDVKGDENFHVWCVDLDSGDIKDLTPRGPEQKVRAEIEAVSYLFPKEILVGLNDRDPEYHDIWRLNIETGAKTLVQKNTEFEGFDIDDNYHIRFASKYTPDGGRELLKPDGKDGWTDFLKIPQADTLTTGIEGFDKSGDVAYLIDSRNRDTGALATLNLKTGEEKIVAEDPRCDAGGIMLEPTERTLQAVSFTYERIHWDFFDPAVKSDFKYLKTVADGDVTVVARTLDDKQWIVAFLMDDGPVRYYHFDRPAHKARFLFTNRKDLEDWKLQKMHPEIINSRDGLNLVSYLTLPPAALSGGKGPSPDRPVKPVPMVIDVHGGPWGVRDEWGLDPDAQLWANRGYAVLQVNYRTSTGFGKKFVNAGEKQWAAKMHDDILDAADWAVAQKIADPKKIAIMGGSYGGYETLVGLTFSPDRFACGVDIVGPSNLMTLLKSIPPYWGPALQMFKDRVGDPGTEAGRKLLTERSPLTFVDRIERPLLIGQGAHDPRVKQAEADQIVHAMQEKHIPVTYVLFPDEGHGFHRPENNIAFTAVTEAFLARNLGGRYQAIGDAFKGSTITVPTGAAQVPGLEAAMAKQKEMSPAEPPPTTAKK
ncbi:MAG TPA: S9 family peptidase [Pirellulales bacterium]|jgi:dipeptidyl aminopeptidase/acylaminoacyl peptidase|nr:S9 family peptidase [Pirellulales bacterium]